MKKTFLLCAFLSLLLGFAPKSKAQQTTILNNEFSYSAIFQYYAVPGAREYYSNFIIQEIAKSIPKRADFTSFTVNYTMMQKIVKLDSTHYKLILELKNFSASGDVFYKGINIAKKLIPGEFDYVAKIYRKQTGNLHGGDPELVVNKTYTSVPLNDNLGYFQIPELAFTDTMKDQQYSVAIENQKLFFNERTKNVFLNQVAYINDYYSTDPVIADNLAKVQNIHTDNIDMLSFYDIELKEVEATIINIDTRQFPQTLNLWENDPMQFVSKMESLSQQTMQARLQLNQRLSILDQLFCQRGNNFMAEGKLQDAANDYNKALQINPYYAPAQYQLARMEYNVGNIDTASVMVNTALLKMNPDPSTQQLLIQLGNTIYTSLLSVGEKYTGEQKFNEAIETYERAKWMCTTTPGMVCTEQATKGLAQARYGIYHSYLQVAEKAIENGRLDIAGNYINQSMEYQKQFSSDIISNSESMQWMATLCKEYVKAGNVCNANKKYELALVQFGRCDSLCKIYSTIGEVQGLAQGLKTARNGKYNNLLDNSRQKLEADKLDNAETICSQAIAYQQMYPGDITSDRDAIQVMAKIKEKRYNIAIASGKNQLNGGNHAEAVRLFLDARAFEENYSFQRNDSLKIWIKASGKPLVLKTIDEGKMNAWGNKLAEARQNYQTAGDEIKLYGLEADRDIEAKMSELKNKIFSQECANAEKSYNELMDKARLYMRDGNYASATTTLGQAIEVTNANILCNIDNLPAYQEQNRIKPAVEYQNMMKNTDALAAKSNYTECLKQLGLCAVFFTTNRIDTFGLSQPTASKYILSGGDANFVYYAVEYFMNLKDHDTALIMLSELKKRNYPVSYTKVIQTQLGAKLAIRDKIAGATDYKIQILKYTDGEKWFKVFSKSYKKTWKKN
ncbi:MAG: hypothetical protein CVU11_07770 [Bacteroidetes bacterium HGW-Bacteroidetes-6]|nr:MAG: hypothetical protein CVU11_07770 [Bacteroidetes bacterium HGW-Bacteroidetes-6]